MLDMDQAQSLLEAARTAAKSAYAPYSGFCVGAALLTAEGQVISGANVENASYGLTVCAERNAIFQAVLQGRRRFLGLAVWAEKTGRVTPCGACRQVMAEFFDPDTPVVMAGEGPGLLEMQSIAQLLPLGFGLPPGEQG